MWLKSLDPGIHRDDGKVINQWLLNNILLRQVLIRSSPLSRVGPFPVLLPCQRCLALPHQEVAFDAWI